MTGPSSSSPGSSSSRGRTRSACSAASSKRYFFTNYSADIRRIFTDHCELLGIRWTQSNSRNISISHRAGVALLDSFIGPKG